MRILSLGVLLATALAASTAYADPVDELDQAEKPAQASNRGPLGIGLILGEPSALSGKYMFAAHSGAQLHVGYGIGNRGRLIVIGDYLFHFHTVIAPIKGAGRLVPYVGVGGRLGISSGDPVLGVRFPVGLSFWLSAAPLEFFVEVAIGLGLIPSTQHLIDGGLGGRFYF